MRDKKGNDNVKLKDLAQDTHKSSVQKSEALSMANTKKDSIQTRQIAFLTAAGSDDKTIDKMKKALVAEGAVVKIIAPKLGKIKGKNGEFKADQSYLTSASVLFDAIFVPGGEEAIKALSGDRDVLNFIEEAYQHCKPLAFDEEAIKLFKDQKLKEDAGVVVDKSPKEFIAAIKQHRFWEREKPI